MLRCQLVVFARFLPVKPARLPPCPGLHALDPRPVPSTSYTWVIDAGTEVGAEHQLDPGGESGGGRYGYL
jgi:hypothetical protein